MQPTFMLSVLAVLLAAFVAPTLANEPAPIPLYQLKVRIDPGAGYLQANATIHNPPASCFYLHPNMEVSGVFADGKAARFHHDTTKSLPFVPSASFAIEPEVKEKLLVEYGGSIPLESLPEMVGAVNRIRPDMVELAIYVGWFPIFEGLQVYNFDLEVDLPDDFVTVTNGALKDEKTGEGRRLTSWTCYGPSFDMVVVASPELRKRDVTLGETTVEVYFAKLPADYIGVMSRRLAKGLSLLTDWYGPAQQQGLVRLVFSPRGGWGYSRLPLIVISEDVAVGNKDQKFGPDRDFRYAAHEMAHFWWSIADVQTPDDWINEGLAEFSAYRVAEAVCGKEFASMRFSEYRHNAARCQTETPIAETQQDSPDREVNRYDKSALLFIEARERFGQEKLDQFLRALHERFRKTQSATTALFLEESEKYLGADARTLFSDALLGKNRTGAN
jgi:hypothetical protein